MMPHKLSYKKVKSVLKSEVEDPLTLMKLIKIHNDSIDISLKRYKKYQDKWGVVEPPLARLLSEPSVRYQEAMVKEHYLVKRAFDSIQNYLKTKTILRYSPTEQHNEGLQQIQQSSLKKNKSITPVKSKVKRLFNRSVVCRFNTHRNPSSGV